MKKLSMRHRAGLATAIVVTLVTCGPSGVEMMGDAMVDAGGAMRDAADALEDTGTVIQDSAGDDAHAQPPACGTCTTNGAVHATLASEDPAQAVGGSFSTTTHAIELAVGPQYLTDLSEVNGFSLASSGVLGGTVAVLWTIPTGSFCDDQHILGTSAGFSAMQTPIAAVDPATPIHGAAIFVPAGAHLCGEAQYSGVWSGFRPYD